MLLCVAVVLVVWHFFRFILILINLRLRFCFTHRCLGLTFQFSLGFALNVCWRFCLLPFESVERDLCCLKYALFTYFTSFTTTIIYLWVEHCHVCVWNTGCQTLAIWALRQKRSNIKTDCCDVNNWFALADCVIVLLNDNVIVFWYILVYFLHRKI